MGRQRAQVRIGRVHTGDGPVRVANDGDQVVRIHLVLDETCANRVIDLDLDLDLDFDPEARRECTA
jgi:hypothetical protein